MSISIDVLTEITKMLGGNPATVQRIEIGPREVEITELVVDENDGNPIRRGESYVRQTYTISVSHEREGGPGVPVSEVTEMSAPRQPSDVDVPCAEYQGPEYGSAFCVRCKFPRMDHEPDALHDSTCSFPGCDREAMIGEDGCGLSHGGGAEYHRVL